MMLLSKAWELCKKDKQLLGFSKYTLRGYSIQADLLVRGLGDKNIEEIELFDLKDYLLEASEHLKPSSVNHRIRFIRSLFRWAHNEGYLQKNISVRLTELKEAQRIPKALSEENLEMLREGCKSSREHALVETFFRQRVPVERIKRIKQKRFKLGAKNLYRNWKKGIKNESATLL